jgi:membrane protease YdiL (CAAX protease family)
VRRRETGRASAPLAEGRVTAESPLEGVPARDVPPESGFAPPPDDALASRLRGFGPVGIAAILVILFTGNVTVGRFVVLPVGAALVLLWAWRSRTPWREIGYVRPRSWIASAAAGTISGIALKFLLKSVVLPLLGTDPVNHAYHFLAGNRGLLPAAVWSMFAAGFGEETVFRGWGFERLGKIIGTSRLAKGLIVIVTSAWFAVGHYANMGLAGMEQAAITGLAFGTAYAVTGRLFAVMCAHTAFDLTALALIYWDLETEVAHLVFR